MEAYRYELPATSQFYQRVVSPACDWLCVNVIPAKVTPNQLTFAGWLCAAAAWVAIEHDQYVLTAILWFLYGIFDNCDGKQARLRKLSSPAGDYLDHVVDAFVTSFLALIVVAIFTPECHKTTAFSFQSYLHGLVRCENTNLLPFVIVLGLSQVPFFIGCWSHHATGRLLLGRKENSRLTVDEINLLLIPGVCLVRWFAAPLFTKSVHLFNLRISADCGGTMTLASLFMSAALLYSTFQSGVLIFQLSQYRTKLHYLVTLVAYVSAVLIAPLPPLVLVPGFAALCSSGIFDRSCSRYLNPEGCRGSVKSMPPLKRWQVYKRYPLMLLIGSSLFMRSMWKVSPSLAPAIALGVVAAYCGWFIFLLRCNVRWLNEAESLVAK